MLRGATPFHLRRSHATDTAPGICFFLKIPEGCRSKLFAGSPLFLIHKRPYRFFRAGCRFDICRSQRVHVLQDPVIVLIAQQTGKRRSRELFFSSDIVCDTPVPGDDTCKLHFYPQISKPGKSIFVRVQVISGSGNGQFIPSEGPFSKTMH